MKSIGIVAVIAVVAIAGFFVFAGEDDSSNSSGSDNQSQANGGSGSAGSEESTGVDRFEYYSDKTVAETADTKRVVFFHANWCSTCKAFEREIRADGVPEGITILLADFDRDTDLKQQYGVTVQSTFVLLDDNGDSLMSWPFGQGINGGISDLYKQVQES